jgi:hypothetical protein
MREVERVVDWILILCQWLSAMPDRAARVLETGRTAMSRWDVAGLGAAYRAAARWGGRRFEFGSLVCELPLLRSIGWMTHCLGQGWTTAPPGLSPALALRAFALLSLAMGRGVRRFVFSGAPGFIDNHHFLSCSGGTRVFTTPAFGALSHSTDFSMPAYAAGL